MFNLDYRLIFFLGCLVSIAIYLFVFTLRKDLRKIMLISSLVFVPFAPIFEMLFYKDYWYPPAFIEANIFGIRLIPEDIIFGFTAPVVGALAYFVFLNIKLNKVFIHFNFKQYLIKMYFLITILFALTVFINLLLNVNSIFSSSIAGFILSFFILLQRKDFIRIFIIISFIEILGVSIFYYLFQLIIGNDYLYSVWLLDYKKYGFNFSGITIPITEIIFTAFVFSFLSLLTMYLINWKPSKENT